jgi:dihydropteroate synthase
MPHDGRSVSARRCYPCQMSRRTVFEWQLRTRSLKLGAATRVMGVLNVTPDSFSDGGRLASVAEAVDVALAMFAGGASIIDIGGESTRPGAAAALSAQQEMDRVLPVIEGIRRAQPEALLSIDTYHAATAESAVTAGAEIVNDVSGLLWDDAMAATCARLGCGVMLMHTRGRPAEWKRLPRLVPGAVVPLVRDGLAQRLAAAQAAGIGTERIVLDPGFGFGKAFEENYPLLRELRALTVLGRPLCVGLSRKGFLGRTLAPLYNGDAPVENRENATLAAVTIAVLHGASIVRVHAVRPAVEAVLIADAMLAQP